MRPALRRLTGRAGALVLVALCALPARGSDPTETELHTLTRIDALPTKEDIIRLTGVAGAIPQLRDWALDSTGDLGVQLRAIRALPHFCSPTCETDELEPPHPAHAALLDVLASLDPGDRSGRSILRLRAVIEALGEIQSGRQSDVDLLQPFLGDASRDLRTTTARALGALCTPGKDATIFALRARYQTEPIVQVQRAIEAALRRLTLCTPL